MNSKISDFFSFVLYACKADYKVVSNACKRFWNNGNVEPMHFFVVCGIAIAFLAIFLIFPRTTAFILFVIWRFYSRAIDFKDDNTDN